MRRDKLTFYKSSGGLGFRNMEAFNLSMLGKQGWKLLNDPSSLLSHILKAKYFPRRDFLDAGIGHNPSYTWKSIWSSQNLINLGYRWKIGDCSQIKVWSSPWIRSLSTLRPSTAAPPHLEHLLVRDLINPDLHTWNSSFISNIFSISDAIAICGLSLHTRNLHDT